MAHHLTSLVSEETHGEEAVKGFEDRVETPTVKVHIPSFPCG